jgi:hypothetical protein
LSPEHLTPWCLILGMFVVHCDDQNVIHLVLDESHFLAFLMQLSVKSISCTSYWASNSFAKELIMPFSDYLFWLYSGTSTGR